MKFHDFGLAEPLLRAIRAEGYESPTPIQTQAIPPAIEGRDVLGCAQTGTGKTAAFSLPVLHRLGPGGPQGRSGENRRPGGPSRRGDHRRGGGRRQADRGPDRPIRALILAPTRELAAQIGESLESYSRHTRLRHTVIFGGVSQRAQTNTLRSGVDVLVATPGRLLDLMQQGFIDLRRIEILVLDEADRMLDMGFIRDIRKIVAQIPTQRQTLMFSATMPKDIRQLADAILNSPTYVQVAAVSSPIESIEQSVYFMEKREKLTALKSFLREQTVLRALVFARTKRGADRIARDLTRDGIEAEAIHGNKSQNARTRAMRKFKSNSPPVLVATDIAARGIDVDEVSHVFNYELPHEPETYVHRIGRTGRAGASGLAISFCDSQERSLLRDIERLIRRRVPTGPGSNNDSSPDPAPVSAATATLERGSSPRKSTRRPTRSRPSGRKDNGGSRRAEFGSDEGSRSESSHRRSSGPGNRSRRRNRRRKPVLNQS